MVDRVFADLKTFLPDFAQRVINQQSAEPVLALTGNFSVEKQKALGMEVMTALGFDFAHGRLDISHHPFCGGVPDDVRITTRYNTDNFVESLMGVFTKRVMPCTNKVCRLNGVGNLLGRPCRRELTRVNHC